MRKSQPLTQWMRTVLADYASGYELKEVAEKHYVSYKSVLRTTQKIKERLGAKHLGQAIIIAHHLGYLTHPDTKGRCFPASPWEDNDF